MKNDLKAKAHRLEEIMSEIKKLEEEKWQLKEELLYEMVANGKKKVGRCYIGYKANTAIYSPECEAHVQKLKDQQKELSKQISDLRSLDKSLGRMKKSAEKMIYIKSR